MAVVCLGDSQRNNKLEALLEAIGRLVDEQRLLIGLELVHTRGWDHPGIILPHSAEVSLRLRVGLWEPGGSESGGFVLLGRLRCGGTSGTSGGERNRRARLSVSKPAVSKPVVEEEDGSGSEKEVAPVEVDASEFDDDGRPKFTMRWSTGVNYLSLPRLIRKALSLWISISV